jgi:hypothetical protein
MSKSVTVNFEDGSAHVYDNVPDDVTDDQIQQRAQGDFQGQKITTINNGSSNPAPGTAPLPVSNQPVEPAFANYSTLPTSAGQIGAAAQIPIQMAAEHPLEAASLAGLYKAGQVGNAYIQGKNVEAQAAQQRAAMQAEAAAGHQAIQQQKINLRANPAVAPVAPQAILGPNGMPLNQPPVTAAAAPVAPQAAQQAANAEQSLVSRIRQTAANKITGLAQASPILGSVGRVAGRVLPGAGAALGGVEAYNRAQAGDYLGAGLAGIGGVASLVPGVGTAIGLGTTGINAARDYSSYLEAKRKYEEQKKAMGR